MEKLTPEQVAWVFDKIIENTKKNPGSFRKLIYDKMGFKSDSYSLLYKSGGEAINNILLEYYHPNDYDSIGED